MSTMTPHSAALFTVAFALAALLSMVPRRDPLWRWEHGDPETRLPSWLPWLALGGLAVASTFFGVMHPLEFAAASGFNGLDPTPLLLVAASP